MDISVYGTEGTLILTFRVDGNFQSIEQNIRLEVELRSIQEQELHRLRRLFQGFQSTVDEIAQLTRQL